MKSCNFFVYSWNFMGSMIFFDYLFNRHLIYLLVIRIHNKVLQFHDFVLKYSRSLIEYEIVSI